MNSILYKVTFNGINERDKGKFLLTFKSINEDNIIKIASQLILDLKNLSENNKNILNFKNVEDVIIIGDESLVKVYNYYYIILTDINNKKEGFLIGNLKKLGDILLGTWPFNKNNQKFSEESIFEKINNILNNYQKYNEICVIT